MILYIPPDPHIEIHTHTQREVLQCFSSSSQLIISLFSYMQSNRLTDGTDDCEMARQRVQQPRITSCSLSDDERRWLIFNRSWHTALIGNNKLSWKLKTQQCGHEDKVSSAGSGVSVSWPIRADFRGGALKRPELKQCVSDRGEMQWKLMCFRAKKIMIKK